MRAWLAGRRVAWSRSRYLAVAIALKVIWVISLVAIAETWSGVMYSMKPVPVSLRVAMAAVGYLWGILLLACLRGGTTGAICRR